MKAKRVLISGRVQGVGFRAWTKRRAEELTIVGYVKNLPDGRVEAMLSGPEAELQKMLLLLHQGPTGAVVSSVEPSDEESESFSAFEIRRG